MAAPHINGFTVAYTAVGGVILWSGVKGTTLSTTFKGLLSGQAPSQNQEPILPGAVPTSDTSSTNGTGSQPTPTGTGAVALKNAAKLYGWDTGSEWQALNNVEMREAGYSTNATNPQSGALGLAQALGHGTSTTGGSLGNEYGGYGLSDAQAKAANSGNAGAQALWMVNYIKATYGDPIGAWQHEQSAGWY